MSSVSQRLSEFVASVEYADLSPEAVAMTKRCLLDALGVSLGASGLGEGTQAFIDLASNDRDDGPCTILGTRRRSGPEAAAFANGALAHALDYEDSHDGALLHPNAPTIPAALALAEAHGPVSGQRFIASIAVGCEIAVRMGLSLRTSLAEFGWYPPPILAAFGATAAGCAILKLQPAQVRDAFSLLQCQAGCSGEIIYSPHSIVRAVRDAFAARAGATSALLAQRGVTGFDYPLEGKAGFFATFARGDYDPDRLVASLGASFEIERISFKPWPSCRGTHAAIEAALNFVQSEGIDAAQIDHVIIRGGPMLRMLAEPSESKRRPATGIDAKFSLPFCVASALTRTQVGLHNFTASALGDAKVLDLAERIDVIIEAPGSARIGAQLEIQLRSGRRVDVRVDRPLGDPERPLTDAALRAKFVECASHAANPLSASAAARVAETVMRLEQLEDLRDLTRLLH